MRGVGLKGTSAKMFLPTALEGLWIQDLAICAVKSITIDT